MFWISLLIKVHMAQKAHKIVGVHKDSTLAQLFAAVPVPAMLKAKDYAGTTIVVLLIMMTHNVFINFVSEL